MNCLSRWARADLAHRMCEGRWRKDNGEVEGNAEIGDSHIPRGNCDREEATKEGMVSAFDMEFN